MAVDRSKTRALKRFIFAPFQTDDADSLPISEWTIDDDEELIVFERGGESRALMVRQMGYHHVAQGVLAGEPYLVSF